MTPTPLNDPPLGIVLAAGAGSRFAGSMHKLLAPIDSVSVIRRSVSVARAAAESGHLSDVVVVVPARDADGDALRYELAGLVCRFAANPDPTIGIAGSLRVAVEVGTRTDAEHLVIGLGDQPFTSVEAWQAVASANTTRRFVVAGYTDLSTPDGVRLAPPVRIARSAWGDLPTTGDHGARRLWQHHPDDVETIAVDGNPLDIDTVDDLAEAEQWHMASASKRPSDRPLGPEGNA